MAHGTQGAENVRIQNWINRFKHAAAPLRSPDLPGGVSDSSDGCQV
jgi:hypothetical protein